MQAHWPEPKPTPLLDFLLFLVGCACSATLTYLAVLPGPPAVVAGPPQLVRMLDVTIKDSNTTNHRQRFECLPVKETK